MSRVQRYPEAGSIRLAQRFAQAAELLAKNGGMGPVSFPLLFLIGHSLELSYKSVLLTCGETLGEMKKIGHDIKKCRSQAILRCPEGLVEMEEPGTEDLVDMIAPYYTAKAFEYHESGYYRLPGDLVKAAEVAAATAGRIGGWVRGTVRARKSGAGE